MATEKSTLGLEVEFLLINQKGEIVYTTDRVIERAKKNNPSAFIIPEIAENMIEFGSTPSVKVSESAQSLLDNINLAVSAASAEKTLLLPMATYPGSFEPRMREYGLYGIKKKLFGSQFPISGRCVGFHLHHALPEGTFDATSKNLKATLSAKSKKSLLEIYNLSIAIDPVLTTLMQSSPFYEGKQLGKDSRMIVYRGGSVLGNQNSLYSGEFESFGDLPRYKLSDTELLDMIIERYSEWKKMIREVTPETADKAQYESLLETNWSPVKINPHGTIEIRGMDMNYPSLVFSISVAAKYLFQDIYQHELHVVPSHEGIAEYFKEENGKLYVPPDNYVRGKLQYLSAYPGMENDSVAAYCKNFLKLARKVMPPSARKLLVPFEEMTENRKTISDSILARAKKHGYSGEGEIPSSIAKELSLEQANTFIDDLERTQKLVEENSNT